MTFYSDSRLYLTMNNMSFEILFSIYLQNNDLKMSSTPASGNESVNITVEVSAKGGDRMVDLNSIPLSTTIGELKTKLQVRPNSRFGRLQEYGDWDNRRPLSDYFVKNGEKFDCVIQCVMTEGQPSFDDYEQWLSAYKSQQN